MTYIVTIHQVWLSLDIKTQCEVMLYYINKGVKKALSFSGKLSDKQVLITQDAKKKQQIQLNHQTLIIDVVLVRQKTGKPKPQKKKAGYVVVHLEQYEQSKMIELELQIKDCLLQQAFFELKFEYHKIVDLFDLPQHSPPKTNQNTKKDNDTQKRQSSAQFKTLAQKVIQLQEKVQLQQKTIKDLQQKLQDSKFDLEEEINKTKRIEDMYRKEKESFQSTNNELRQQLMLAKSQLTQVMDVLNQRGEASILQIIEDMITK